MEKVVTGAVAFAGRDATLDLAEDTRQTFDRNLVDHGYVYLYNVPDNFDHLALLKELGDFMPQYDGKVIWDLTPEPNMDDVYHSRNTRALVPHTEAYEYPFLPPRYLALWCVKPAAGPGGETTLADGRTFLSGFNLADQELMRSRQYHWVSSEGLARKNIRVESHHPILEQHDQDTVMRYSYNNVERVEDGFIRRYLEAGLEFFDREHLAIRIERNGLLVWDNWRMLHSRTAFKDRGRHLKRVLIAA